MKRRHSAKVENEGESPVLSLKRTLLRDLQWGIKATELGDAQAVFYPNPLNPPLERAW